MDFQLPELGEGVYEAEMVAWLVKTGDTVKRGQALMEVLTDKASMEVPSPFAGVIGELRAEPGADIKVGQVVLKYEPSGAAAQPVSPGKGNGKSESRAEQRVEPATPPDSPPRWTPGSASVGVQAAPSVRYLARKMGIDLANVRGSGPGGRILIDDVTARMGQAAVEKPTVEPQPDFGKAGTRLKLHGLRRKIAEHMVLAKQTIPHYSYVDECDVTELVRLRASLKERFAEAGVKLTYLAFFVRAVVAALKDVPIINSSLDEKAGEIVLHDHYHIGIAVATPQGLIVPVIHEADRKDLGQVAREIERLSAAARAGKIKLEDLRGGTFTITSVGNIGGLFSTPVINHPEVAILGLGKVVKRPVFDATGDVRPAEMMYLSYSFDHRVLDGAVGAAFSNAVIRRLHNPATLLLSDKI